MQKRRIGQGDREVSAIGYGATGQSSGCGPATGWQQAIALVRAAVDVLGRRCRVDGA